MNTALSIALTATLLVDTARAQDPERGAYLAAASGCLACHTAEGGEPFAGGHAIETGFGTFYGSNITSDPEHGIGGWSEQDFVRALRKGISPEGRPYYPAFPFTSYTNLTDEDLRDLFAWSRALPAVAAPEPRHELKLPYRARIVLWFWRLFEFDQGPLEPDPSRSAEWNRGAYLVNGPGHCGECHTPRNALGGLKERRGLAGAADPPHPAPNITPHAHGIGSWSAADLEHYLEDGMTPDGDFAGAGMSDVIEHSTSRLTAEDRRAMVVYLQSVAPLPTRGRTDAPADEDAEDW